jgi:hypothetical protein
VRNTGLFDDCQLLVFASKSLGFGRRLSDASKGKHAEFGKQTVGTLSRQLDSSHFLPLLPTKDALKW